VVLSRQTGLMSIEYSGGQRKEQGEIYFEAGQVVLARTGSEAGVTALARIQDWHTAHYTFYEDATIPLHSIRADHSHSELEIAGAKRPGRQERREREAHTSPLVMPSPAKSTRPLPQIQATLLPPSSPAQVDAPEPTPPGRYAIFRARPSTATPATMKRLERRERIVFALLDGRHTLQDVARLTHQSDVSVARILVQLFKQGYIDYIRG